MSQEPSNPELKIIAGPCSIDNNNLKEVYQISEIEVKNRAGSHQRAIAGTRVVGLKSRTELDASGHGMGLDYSALKKNMETLMNGGSAEDFVVPPSALMAVELANKTDLIIATEVMMPSVQLPAYEGKIAAGKLMPWSPAVNQLGWQILEMANFARRNGWHVGIKNGKWVGETIAIANSSHYTGQTTMEKTWAGLATYAGDLEGDIILIHRGVDAPDKGRYRNLPVHQMALRTKRKTGAKLYFDPSHAYGPKMKEDIVPAVIEAMKMKLGENTYLYDGVLVEAGTSVTDTEQHITLKELEIMVNELSTFRNLVAPEAKKLQYTKGVRPNPTVIANS